MVQLLRHFGFTALRYQYVLFCVARSKHRSELKKIKCGYLLGMVVFFGKEELRFALNTRLRALACVLKHPVYSVKDHALVWFTRSRERCYF